MANKKTKATAKAQKPNYYAPVKITPCRGMDLWGIMDEKGEKPLVVRVHVKSIDKKELRKRGCPMVVAYAEFSDGTYAKEVLTSIGSLYLSVEDAAICRLAKDTIVLRNAIHGANSLPIEVDDFNTLRRNVLIVQKFLASAKRIEAKMRKFNENGKVKG